VAVIGARGEDYSSLLAPAAPAKPQRDEAPPRTAAGPSGRALASPAAKAEGQGTQHRPQPGPRDRRGGLITEKDIEAFADTSRRRPGRLWPRPLSMAGRSVSRLRGIAKAMYERMTLSASIPQVTTVAETDATDLLELSKAKGISVTTFIVRAVVEGLKRFPRSTRRATAGPSFAKGISTSASPSPPRAA